MLQFALRLGTAPRVCVTTTPRNVPLLKQLLQSPSTVTTHAPTEANRANLASSFLAEVRARYAGSRLARQELDGVMLADHTVQGQGPAGWARAAIAARDAYRADRLVAEVNQGGALVGSVLRQVDPLVPFTPVHASTGKAARAEPVAALY